MRFQRPLLAAALLGLGGLALAMPGGPHRHDAEAKAEPGAGCHEGMAMKDGMPRGPKAMGGMHRHGDAGMQHRHEDPAPAEKTPPQKP